MLNHTHNLNISKISLKLLKNFSLLTHLNLTYKYNYLNMCKILNIISVTIIFFIIFICVQQSELMNYYSVLFILFFSLSVSSKGPRKADMKMDDDFSSQQTFKAQFVFQY